MKCRIRTSFVIVVFVEVLASGLNTTTFAQTNAALDTTDLAADEKAACFQNLKAIYDAIQAQKETQALGLVAVLTAIALVTLYSVNKMTDRRDVY